MRKNLRLGMQIEMEHKRTMHKIKRMCKSGRCPTDKAIARMISSDHIREDKNYYSHLIKMERRK